MVEIILRASLFLAMIVCVLALDSGFYHIQSVAFGKSVEARQQGLPLFIEKNLTLFVHPVHEQDYTVWRVDKGTYTKDSETVYTLQHNVTKMYAQVYREASNTTLVIAEKVASPLKLKLIGDHEWIIQLPGPGAKSVWTIEEPHNQITVASAVITRKGIPRASQRFRLHPVRA